MFASKHACPDVQVAVAFLCTHVSKPTQQDYKKFARVIQYLKSAISLPLNLGSEDKGDDKGPNEHPPFTWNIDASYVVHHDTRSYTRTCLLLGTGGSTLPFL